MWSTSTRRRAASRSATRPPPGRPASSRGGPPSRGGAPPRSRYASAPESGTITSRRRPPSAPWTRAARWSSSTSRSVQSPRDSRACGMTAIASWAAGSSSGLVVDTRADRVIVFTNLQRHHETGGILLMLQRGSRWRGWLTCAFVSLLLALPALALAASAGEEHGGGGLISVDKSLIVQVVNFLILLFIPKRLLYKPFLAKMEERTNTIQKALDEAKAARADAAKQQEDNEARLRAAYAG